MVKLILVRHGQSIWNLENRFTGWINVSLSKKGIEEAQKAGKILKDFKFDIAYTSTLNRAQQTLFKILEENNNCNGYMVKPIFKKEWYERFFQTKTDKNVLWITVSERLNERFYGDLQGLNKDDARKKYGEDQVHIWRRSYDIAPPNGESLKDTYKRTVPYFKKQIIKDLKAGKNVIVAAHGNSLRAIIKYLEDLNADEIINTELETGVPICYEFDQNLKIKSKTILKSKPKKISK